MSKEKLCLHFILTSVILYSTASSAAVYKYKDESGNWVFGDKKPSSNIEAEEVAIKQSKKKIAGPKIYLAKSKVGNALQVNNPFHAPIEIGVTSQIFGNSVHRQTIPAASTITLYESEDKLPPSQYRWVLGSPKSVVQRYSYRFPVDSPAHFEISQGFKGAFSHTDISNHYAVDIAMPVGTFITAARGGVVIWSKDDYHMGGQAEYFLDKANYVSILHDDGSYAQYAHILQGSARVKAGDRIDAGDVIARSGSSGFSTGPHLHFVIRTNVGLQTHSVEFVFADNNGGTFTPKRGMLVKGR